MPAHRSYNLFVTIIIIVHRSVNRKRPTQKRMRFVINHFPSDLPNQNRKKYPGFVQPENIETQEPQ